MNDLPSRVKRRRGCPHIIILQGFLLLLTHLFIEGVSNRRDFIYVQVFGMGVNIHFPSLQGHVVSSSPHL